RSEGDPAVTVSAERQAPAGPGQVPAGRPRLLLPGLLPADPRLERYRVHPGAVTAVELDAGDEITVIDAEGRQRGELTVLARGGAACPPWPAGAGASPSGARPPTARQPCCGPWQRRPLTAPRAPRALRLPRTPRGPRAG